jgi:uncharacterized protein (TIGR02145 family)
MTIKLGNSLIEAGDINKEFAPEENKNELKKKLIPIITIGAQEWMSENLNVEHYRSGDPIHQVQNKDEWLKLTTGAWCYYNNDPANGNTFGKLYNWYAVNDSRGLAPEGWHVASDEEWTKLTDYLGGEKSAGGKLKATALWKSLNTGTTNSSGFTAFPCGFRFSIGDFNDVAKYGYFWSASEFNGTLAWFRYLSYVNSGVLRGYGFKKNGLSIRCLKD